MNAGSMLGGHLWAVAAAGGAKSLLFIVFMVLVPLVPVTVLLARRLSSRNRDVVSGRAEGTPMKVISIVGAVVLGAALVFLVIVLGAQALLSDEGRSVDPREGGANSSFGDPSDPTRVQGDARAGKAIFLSSGCGDCHELADAGKNGARGPSLDQDQPDFATVVECLTTGPREMPSFTTRLSAGEIRNVAKYVSTVAGNSTDPES